MIYLDIFYVEQTNVKMVHQNNVLSWYCIKQNRIENLAVLCNNQKAFNNVI